MPNPRAELVFVDVDDTLVRSAGTKRIPIAAVVDRVKTLKDAGATLYCWSTGGAEYAREAALELGLEDCFVAFLPKPTVILEDQAPAEWRMCRYVHPSASRRSKRTPETARRRSRGSSCPRLSARPS